MTRMGQIRLEDVKPGYIVRDGRRINRRVERLERLDDFQAYYRAVRQYRLHFTDGTNELIQDHSTKVLAVLTDSGKLVGAGTLAARITSSEPTTPTGKGSS